MYQVTGKKLLCLLVIHILFKNFLTSKMFDNLFSLGENHDVWDLQNDTCTMIEIPWQRCGTYPSPIPTSTLSNLLSVY